MGFRGYVNCFNFRLDKWVGYFDDIIMQELVMAALAENEKEHHVPCF